MKYDKETIIVMGICLVLLMLSPMISEKLGLTKPVHEKQPTVNVDNPVKGDTKTTSAPEASKPAEIVKTEVKPKPVKTAAKEVKTVIQKVTTNYKTIALNNDISDVKINPNIGTIESITLKKFYKTDYKTKVVLNEGSEPGALALNLPEKWILTEIDEPKIISDTEASVTRKYTVLGVPVSLTQSWKLIGDYQVQYNVDIKNNGTTPVVLTSLGVNAGSITPILILCGDVVRRENININYCIGKNRQVDSISSKAKEKKFKRSVASLKWVAVTNKYFACILMPSSPFTGGNELGRSDKKTKADIKYKEITTSGVFNNISIAPGSVSNFNFKYYAGPKELALLKKVDKTTLNIMGLSWWSKLEWIAQYLLIALIYLKSVCGSYGLSIILLTIIVKGIFWPITQRANASMKKMQKIQPMVKEIREKHKDNPQVLNTKMMTLYKEHKVNPLGGCLPILLQLPVFFALYSTLGGAVELRHIPFLWATDLSRPDAIGPEIAGYQLHPLILMMCALMVLQQKLTPSAADPAQRKMMMIMPFVMLVLLYSLPSGLTLYWTVSQAISIIQLLINKKEVQAVTT